MNTIAKVSEATTAAGAAKYNVFKLPTESPNHGTRQIVLDDQYPAASPYGWHDTNGATGAEFTITRGNNVYAYQDKDDDDVSDGTDTDGGSGLNFDFAIDFSRDSREIPDASVTNLFYMVNMMHDLSNEVGFTEEFGNFQDKNYSGKNTDGEGDYVLAQAFDGITKHEAKQDLDANNNPTKINNANFSTPIDGFNGRMQMFFWDNDAGAVSIDSPESIKGYVAEYGTAGFGKPIPLKTETAVTGKLVIGKDASTNPTTCCNNLIEPEKMKGNFVIIDRGVCEFSTKVLKAQNAGAIAVIICNVVGVDGGNGEQVIGMSSGTLGASVTIPSVFFKKSDCDKIRIIINNGGEVTMTLQEKDRVGGKYIDGSFDNGVIAHEFGHGISTRLTGGRKNSGCLNNDEQMGEGWSDFFALVMTHEPGDAGTDYRGIGTFDAAQLATGSGIRRYPYSTDMKINPQTFKDIKGTTAPHPLGEVWTDCLWDMYWGFIDQYGYNADWSNKESGNHKAIYLVMEGMKMQKCQPGFIDGRDAILKADSIHYNNANSCLIWDVFARRGVGHNAIGGLSTDRNDGTEGFETFPICLQELKIYKTMDGSVDAGGEVNVKLRAINHIPSTQNNVIITDELENGLTYVDGSSPIAPKINGNMLIFELGDMEYKKEIELNYLLKTNPNNVSTGLLYEDFTDFTWDTKDDVGSIWNFGEVYRSPETSMWIANEEVTSNAYLVSPVFDITGNNPTIKFWQMYNTESVNDGGVIELSVDGGAFYIVPKDKFIRNPYNSQIAYGTFVLPSLDGFSGSSNGEWIDSYFEVSEYVGKKIQLRWRYGSNNTGVAKGAFVGWAIDDFEILDVYKYNTQTCISTENGAGENICVEPMKIVVNSGKVNTKDENLDYYKAYLTPNPAGDYVVVHASSPTRVVADVELKNVAGHTIYRGKMNINTEDSISTINLANIPSGFYMITIQSGNNVSNKKLIIK